MSSVDGPSVGRPSVDGPSGGRPGAGGSGAGGSGAGGSSAGGSSAGRSGLDRPSVSQRAVGGLGWLDRGPSAEGPALLAVAHGSRDDRSVPVLERLVTRVQQLLPGVAVHLAYIDHRPPSLSRALAEHPDEPMVVLPLLLTAASHSKGDVAAAVRQADPSGRRLRQARPITPHTGVIAALNQRLAEAGVAADTAIVVASIGSADPDANADVVADARRLWEWRGGAASVEAGFASATRPRVGEVVDRFRRLGERRVAVASYSLAPGLLLDSAVAGLDVAAVAEPLADTAPIASAVVERYREALDGDIRMGCDTCVYRVAWPGRDARVGAPQKVHSHPDD